MRRLGWAAAVIVLLAAAAAVAYRQAVHDLDEPLAVAATTRFIVPPGASFSRIANDLASRGFIAQPRVWVLYARWTGFASSVKAGEYEIQPGVTPRELLSKMVSGQVLLHSFTIVDGWRTRDMLDALRRNPDVAMTLPVDLAGPAQDALLMQAIGAPEIDAEGQFLPETYRFIAGTADVEVLRQAHAALVKELDAAWAERAADLPLRDRQELLIMASIIEKESGLPQELPKIAGLYLHRLSIGMRLQADPTIIYGMGERYAGDIHSVDLRTDGPYNTYTRSGLPPTPISLPSAAVLRATAQPEKTTAIYFVASGKGDGSHVFSATLDEQNAAVAAYLARQRHKAVVQ